MSEQIADRAGPEAEQGVKEEPHTTVGAEDVEHTLEELFCTIKDVFI